MSMLTIEIADATAADLARQAKQLGMTVDDLVEAIATQYLNDAGGVVDLTDEQMEQIRQSLADPRPSISHEDVMARLDDILTARK
jgi:antitoxin component of RelBE/YafQ-DinJ toxin-antitoxin module